METKGLERRTDYEREGSSRTKSKVSAATKN